MAYIAHARARHHARHHAHAVFVFGLACAAAFVAFAGIPATEAIDDGAADLPPRGWSRYVGGTGYADILHDIRWTLPPSLTRHLSCVRTRVHACLLCSWNSFGLQINEEVVRSSADIMAAELLPSGYEYLLIDDG